MCGGGGPGCSWSGSHAGSGDAPPPRGCARACRATRRRQRLDCPCLPPAHAYVTRPRPLTAYFSAPAPTVRGNAPTGVTVCTWRRVAGARARSATSRGMGARDSLSNRAGAVRRSPCSRRVRGLLPVRQHDDGWTVSDSTLHAPRQWRRRRRAAVGLGDGSGSTFFFVLGGNSLRLVGRCIDTSQPRTCSESTSGTSDVTVHIF